MTYHYYRKRCPQNIMVIVNAESVAASLQRITLECGGVPH